MIIFKDIKRHNWTKTIDTGDNHMDKLSFLILFARNLKELIESQNMNSVDLADKLDTTKSTTARWLRAESFPRKEQFQCLCDSFNIAPSYFFKEQPSIIVANASKDIVPLYSSESLIDKTNIVQQISVAHDILNAYPGMFAVKCTDDAMDSIMHIPSICYITPTSNIPNGSIVLIQLKPNEPPIFRQYTKAGRVIVLSPMTDHDRPDDIVIHIDNMPEILGVVTTIRIDLEHKPFNSKID